jgi:3'(2'), 5'-bisphosphate nucleotidase
MLNKKDHIAIAACLAEASAAILEVYHSAGFKVIQKSDFSPLTEADQKANEIICNFLSRHFPDIPILSEENKQQPYEERKQWEYFWLLDPLDGTKEFVSKNGDFTINLALCKNNRPVTGYIFIPVLNSLYFNPDEHMAIRNNKEGERKISSRSFTAFQQGLGIISSRSHMNEATRVFCKQFKEPDFVQRGSALKFMQLAEGRADIYPRFASTMEWDTAAGDAILAAAGGKIFQVVHPKVDELKELKHLMEYNKSDLTNPGFIAMGILKY